MSYLNFNTTHTPNLSSFRKIVLYFFIVLITYSNDILNVEKMLIRINKTLLNILAGKTYYIDYVSEGFK